MALGGSNCLLQLQHVTVKEVSCEGRAASSALEGGRYSMDARHVVYGHETETYGCFGRDERLRVDMLGERKGDLLFPKEILG